MSSHHIVREDQEPALLILDCHAIPLKFIEQLLEWSPTVIVSEAAIDYVLSWGIKIDVAIVSDSYFIKDELINQRPIRIIQTDNSLLLMGIQFVMERKYKAVNVLFSKMEELDIVSINTANLDIVAFCNKIRYGLINKGRFEKWLSQGVQLYIYPTINVKTVGLNEQLVTVSNGLIAIESQDFFWIGEKLH